MPRRVSSVLEFYLKIIRKKQNKNTQMSEIIVTIGDFLVCLKGLFMGQSSQFMVYLQDFDTLDINQWNHQQ